MTQSYCFEIQRLVPLLLRVPTLGASLKHANVLCEPIAPQDADIGGYGSGEVVEITSHPRM